MVSAPCKDCMERHIGCHGKCNKYSEYKEAHQIEMEKVIKYREYQSYVSQVVYDMKRKH